MNAETLADIIDSAAGSVAREDLGLGVVWNGSCTWNVFLLETGECLDCFMTSEAPASAWEAFCTARDWLANLTGEE